MFDKYQFKNIKEVKDTLRNKNFVILSSSEPLKTLLSLEKLGFQYIKTLEGIYKKEREVSFLVKCNDKEDFDTLKRLAGDDFQSYIIETFQDNIWLFSVLNWKMVSSSKRKYYYKNATKQECYTTVKCLNGKSISFYIKFK